MDITREMHPESFNRVVKVRYSEDQAGWSFIRLEYWDWEKKDASDKPIAVRKSLCIGKKGSIRSCL